MFNKNHQNRYFIHPHHHLKQKIFDNCINKYFFDHFEEPDKRKQIETIEKFKKFQDERFSRGYGAIGFENLASFLPIKWILWKKT